MQMSGLRRQAVTTSEVMGGRIVTPREIIEKQMPDSGTHLRKASLPYSWGVLTDLNKGNRY